MSTRTMYITLNPGEINGNLCCHKGILCYIAPNYIQLSTEPIEDKDANTHCHAIQVPEGDVKEVQNGAKTEHWLWKGPHEGRYNEGDKSVLPIANTGATESSLPEKPEAPLPLEVQFAGLVVQLADETLDSWPNMGKVHIEEWKEKANAIIDAFNTEKI